MYENFNFQFFSFLDGTSYGSDGNVYYSGGSAVSTTAYAADVIITIEVDMNTKRVRYFRDKVQLPYYIQSVPASVVFCAFGYTNSILETISFEEVEKSMATSDQNAVNFGS
jgi:hypothetical protein